ncbi:MAG: hypothetical protein SFU86_19855 [Pirellulaceae bacterium]|nr:hypothetical protein [Pirellulaceae bacterium]
MKRRSIRHAPLGASPAKLCQIGPTDDSVVIEPVETTLFLLSLLLAVVTFVLSCWVIAEIGTAPAMLPIIEQMLPEIRQHVHPEPLERRMYLWGLLCMPILPAIFYAMLCWWGRRYPGHLESLRHPRCIAIQDGLLLVGGVLWITALASSTKVPGFWPRLLVAALIATVMVAVCRIRWQSWKWLDAGLAVVLLIACFRLLYVNDETYLSSSDQSTAHHLEVVLGAVLQAANGRIVLIDTTSQYGVLYPYVTALAVAPFGLSLSSVSIFFALLNCACLVLGWASVRQHGELPWVWELATRIGLAGWVISFTGYVLFQLEGSLVYYQYFPIRTLSGFFFLWLTAVVAKSSGRLRVSLVVLGYVAAGGAVLWNLDTGLVVLIAWTAFNVFAALIHPSRTFRSMVAAGIAHAVCAAGTLALWVLSYALVAWGARGQWPTLQGALEYQRIFYVAGFFMLPMRMWELWQPLILVYLIAIGDCLRRCWHGTADHRTAWRMFAALLGMGVFSYYQGRSHIQVLLAVVYPAVLLCIDYGSAAAVQLRQWTPGYWWTLPAARRALLISWSAALLPALGIVLAAGAVPAAVEEVFFRESTGATKSLEPTLARYREILRGRKLVIASSYANYLHAQTGTCSALPCSAIAEVMLASQAEEIIRLLTSGDVEFLIVDERAPRVWLTILPQVISSGAWEPIAKDSGLVVFRRVALQTGAPGSSGSPNSP